MAVYIRVIYLVCLADNLGAPQAIPQIGIAQSIAYLFCLAMPQRVLACYGVPLSAMGQHRSAVLIAGNVKPWEFRHSTQGTYAGNCQPVVNVCRSGQSAAYTHKPMAVSYGRRKA